MTAEATDVLRECENQTIDNRARASAYDLLAPHYRAYSQSRGDYLRAVDEFVISHVACGARSLLDVGAGDGVRAHEIARACRIERLVLAEPSRVMSDYCRRLSGVEVWQVAAEDLPAPGERFDAITCLWNVLGHLDSPRGRLAALCRMCSLLADGGLILLDANNRYNARAYGPLKTAARAIFDLISPAASNGDVSFDWDFAGRCIRARGHVFTPAEVEALAARAGLRVRERRIIDYRTGERRRFVFEGQLLYALERASTDGTRQPSTRSMDSTRR